MNPKEKYIVLDELINNIQVVNTHIDKLIKDEDYEYIANHKHYRKQLMDDVRDHYLNNFNGKMMSMRLNIYQNILKYNPMNNDWIKNGAGIDENYTRKDR